MLLAALALRLPLWWRLLPHPEGALRPDSPTYLAPAQSLAAGRGFLGVDGQPDAVRTPGYPALLALHRFVSDRAALPTLTQCLLDSGTAVLASELAVALAGPAAWPAGLLYALDPVAAAHAPLLLSEALFGFLLTLSALLSLRGPPAAAGLSYALATLTRPVTMFLWPIWAPALAWARGRRPALVFALCAGVPLALWCGRNLARFGAFEFTSIHGQNLLWEAAAAMGVTEGAPHDETRVALEARALEAGPYKDAFDRSRRMLAVARAELRGRKLALLRLHAVSTVKMLAGPGVDALAEVVWPGRPLPGSGPERRDVMTGSGTRALLSERPILWLPLLWTLALLAAVYALAARGAWRLWKEKREEAVLMLVPVLYLLAVSGGSWGYYRLRLPLMPLLAALAGCAFLRKRP